MIDVSVIIVNWNTRELLRACLASCPQRMLEAHSPGAPNPSENHTSSGPVCGEIIVVDNASGDGSAEMVAREFPGVRLIRNVENRGFAAANNQGFAVAGGRYVLLLNSDTEVLGDAIERSVAWADDHPATAVMGCRVLNPDRTMQPTCFRDPGLLDLTLIAAGLHLAERPAWLGRLAGRQVMRGWDRTDERDVDVVTGCYMLVRRSAIDVVGMLDEGFFFYGEEADWCRRFRDAGFGVRFAPVGEIVHLGGASTLRIAGERGVLLGRAITRLIGKHRGAAVAMAAWGILLASHIWRAAALGAAGACTFNRDRLARARMAASTALRFGRAWPRLT